MARTMAPIPQAASSSSMHEDAPHLDGQYAAFGKVTEGMDEGPVEVLSDGSSTLPTSTIFWKPLSR
jgi:cyclophilin family peptidyl-prolyl cis-trans isomerase